MAKILQSIIAVVLLAIVGQVVADEDWWEYGEKELIK